jgi:hypothetical protein
VEKFGTPKLDVPASSKLPALPPPKFTGQDLEEFCQEFALWMRLTGLSSSDDRLKMDWFVMSTEAKFSKLVGKTAEDSPDFASFLERMQELFPKLENDIALRQQIKSLPELAEFPTPTELEVLLINLDSLLAKMSKGSTSEQEQILFLVGKMKPQMVKRLRQIREDKPRWDSYDGLKKLLRERVQEQMLEDYIAQQQKEQQNPQQVMYAGAKTQSTREMPPPRFRATVVCKFCKKKGHYEDECWTKEKVERKEKARQREKDKAKPPETESNAQMPIGDAQIGDNPETKKRKLRLMLAQVQQQLDQLSMEGH